MTGLKLFQQYWALRLWGGAAAAWCPGAHLRLEVLVQRLGGAVVGDLGGQVAHYDAAQVALLALHVLCGGAAQGSGLQAPVMY